MALIFGQATHIHDAEISISGVTNGQCLVYHSADNTWIPSAVVASSAINANQINGTDVTDSTLYDGYVLVYDSDTDAWVPSNIFDCGSFV